VSGVRDCGRHIDEDRAWLDHCVAEVFAAHAGTPWLYGCLNCGEQREAEWQDELVCACGWSMVSLGDPETSRGDRVAPRSPLKSANASVAARGHPPG
jgi:hypothetical protein